MKPLGCLTGEFWLGIGGRRQRCQQTISPGDKEPVRSGDAGGQHLPQLAPGIV